MHQNIINRLNGITIGCTTTIGDSVVTRWSGGFEIGTFGKRPFLGVDDVADKILQAIYSARTAGAQFDAQGYRRF